MKEKDTESDSETASESARESGSRQSESGSDGGSVAALHGAFGNSGVQRLHEAGDLQASLEVSQPGDEHEEEAERVAEQVMTMSSPQAAVGEEGGQGVQRTPGGSGGGSGAGAKQQVESATGGGGKPLGSSTRSYFEPRFGQDFSDVSVHTGSQADTAARSINAEAFTMGTDIAFSKGSYEPSTSSGKKLLAHELTHVVQQGGSEPKASPADGDGVQRSADSREGSGEGLPSIQRVAAGTGSGGRSLVQRAEARSQESGGGGEGGEGGGGEGGAWYVPKPVGKTSALGGGVQSTNQNDSGSTENLEAMKEGEPVLDVQASPPTLEGGYKWTMGSKEYDFFDQEWPVGNTPFVVGLGAGASMAAEWGVIFKGEWKSGEEEQWFPADLNVSLNLMSGFSGELHGDVWGGAGLANLASMGVEGTVRGKAELKGTAGGSGTLKIDENQQVTDIVVSLGNIQVEPALVIELDVGPYIRFGSAKWEWPVTVGSWDVYKGTMGVSAVVLRYGSDGLDVTFGQIQVNDQNLNGPTFEEIGNPMAGLTSWIMNAEDNRARKTIESMKEAGTLDQLSSERKTELMNMILDGAVANESENRILDILYTVDDAEEARLLLIDAHYKDQGSAPESGETLYEWADGWMDGDQWDELTTILGGDGHDYFRPWAFQEPNNDDYALNHHLYNAFIDYYREIGGMKKEQSWF